MDTQMKSFNIKLKISKLKRSFQKIEGKNEALTNQAKKRIFESIVFPEQFLQMKQLKQYQDNHIFKPYQLKSSISTLQTTKSQFSNEATLKQVEQLSLVLSTNKKSRKFSYLSQKNQKISKTQRAKQNLKYINELKINHINSRGNKSVRFNKQYETVNYGEDRSIVDLENSLKIDQNLNSQAKINKYSHNRKFTVSTQRKVNVVRLKTFYEKAKQLSFSTIDSNILKKAKDNLHRPPSETKLEKRKSSITPWDITEQISTR